MVSCWLAARPAACCRAACLTHHIAWGALQISHSQSSGCPLLCVPGQAWSVLWPPCPAALTAGNCPVWLGCCWRKMWRELQTPAWRPFSCSSLLTDGFLPGLSGGRTVKESTNQCPGDKSDPIPAADGPQPQSWDPAIPWHPQKNSLQERLVFALYSQQQSSGMLLSHESKNLPRMSEPGHCAGKGTETTAYTFPRKSYFPREKQLPHDRVSSAQPLLTCCRAAHQDRHSRAAASHRNRGDGGQATRKRLCSEIPRAEAVPASGTNFWLIHNSE